MEVDHIAFFAKLEDKGEDAVRIDFAKGIYAGTKASLVQDWLRNLDEKREAAFLARSEAREDESLSISRKALRNSERANTIAISAIVLSIITAIAVAIIEYLNP